MPAISTISDVTTKFDHTSDDVIRLRRWGNNNDMEMLPRADHTRRIELVVGTSRACHLRVSDKHVSGEHARLVFDERGWTIQDLKSKNGLWLDNQRCEWGPLRPGTEIGLGRKFIMIAESPRSIALRTFLTRILGWGGDRAKAIDLALRSILAPSAQRSAIAVCSPSDPLAIAHSIHRVVYGARPFVRCDPKGKPTDESVRWPRNFTKASDALAAAAGGTLCVWAGRLPRDYDEIWSALVEPTATTRLVVCSNKPINGKEFLTVPIIVPPLSTRPDELPHIIREYAKDAVAELSGQPHHARPEDLDWIQQHEASSLAKIEAATLRCIALRIAPNMNQAAKLLGMARESLAGWIKSRKMPMHVEG